MATRQALDRESRRTVPAKKKQRDRLIALAEAHDDWVVGYQDEVWWSRFAQPQMYAWAPGAQPIRLVERIAEKTETEPRALCCYGVVFDRAVKRSGSQSPTSMRLRFINDRAVSKTTIAFLQWVSQSLAEDGVRVWVLVWDNAPWHRSLAVRTWLSQHNAHVKRHGGVRIINCPLPTKSPWLNPIEPLWVHAKRNIAEAKASLSIDDVVNRVHDYFRCQRLPFIATSTP
jgi:transposase